LRRLIRFVHLPGAQKMQLLRAAWLLAAAAAGVRLLPFRLWRGWLGSRAGISVSAEQVREATWAIVAVAPAIPEATCLAQALAAAWWLHDLGYGSELRLGVARAGEEFRAHAWLESGGQILIGGEHSATEYVALAEASRP